METRWLRDFEALAAQKNFSRAAADCNVSQPAFSRRIRMLEDEVGVKLIDRQTLPLSLTPAGEVFLQQARRIMDTYAEMIDRCQTIDAAQDDVIRFATSQSLYLTHYSAHIAPLVENGGLDVDLNSTSWSADQFVSALQQRYCDVILTYWHPAMDFLSPLEVSNFEYIILARDRFLPVSKTGAQGVPLHYLPNTSRKPVPVLSYGKASALSSVVSYLMRQQIKQPSLLVVNQNVLAVGVKAMIEQGFGMGWLPRAICQEELADGSLTIAGDDTYATDLEIRLYRDPENSKPMLDILWNRIRKEANLAA